MSCDLCHHEHDRADILCEPCREMIARLTRICRGCPEAISDNGKQSAGKLRWAGAAGAKG
jgi:hypothetical protein